MVYTAHKNKMKTRLLPVKWAMLRDEKTTSIAERMRRPPLGCDAVPAAKAEGIKINVSFFALYFFAYDLALPLGG
jgi:hypothetical protein